MAAQLVLGIETATDFGGVAIADEAGLRVALSADLGLAHSRQTTALMRQALQLAGVRPEAITAVGVSIGPGSFTGVRIGLSAAKGFCLATGAGLIGVSTLEALAWRAAPALDDAGVELVSPLIDARRGEVYAALFQRVNAAASMLTAFERRHDDCRLPLAQWVMRLKDLAGPSSRLFFTGPAVGPVQAELSARLSARAVFAAGERAQPGGDAVAQLALRRLLADPGCGRDWETLEPEYVRGH